MLPVTVQKPEESAAAVPVCTHLSWRISAPPGALSVSRMQAFRGDDAAELITTRGTVSPPDA